jgi:hypothetical protein
MTLLSAIPGLSAHEMKIPAAPIILFDRDKAVQILRDGISLINSFYPAGAMEWLRENRPDVIKQLKSDLLAIEQAISNEDHSKVSVTIELGIKHHRRAFELFELRPPVIEVQGDLLAA